MAAALGASQSRTRRRAKCAAPPPLVVTPRDGGGRLRRFRPTRVVHFLFLTSASFYGLTCAMDLTQSQSAPTPITANLRLILLGLCSAMGMWGWNGLRTLLFCLRVKRVFAQIERMLAAFRAGQLPVLGYRSQAPDLAARLTIPAPAGRASPRLFRARTADMSCCAAQPEPLHAPSWHNTQPQPEHVRSSPPLRVLGSAQRPIALKWR